MHYRFSVLAVNIATQPYSAISHARTLTWFKTQIAMEDDNSIFHANHFDSVANRSVSDRSIRAIL